MSAGGDSGKWRALVLTALAVVLTLSTWFSATSVAPALTEALGLSEAEAIWLTNAVQAGFVIGALVSSFLSIADIWPMARIMAVAAALAALSNGALLLATEPWHAVAARFCTGAALALVYPPAMKFISTWFRTGRGLAMGAMVGALTLGSAAPHLVRALGSGLEAGTVIAVTTAASLLAALLFWFLREGPYPFSRAKVDPRQLGAILRNKPVMLANLGYFGHMWELYAMWGWILAFATSASLAGEWALNASMLVFFVVALGAPSCVFAGLLADRIGRCTTTALAMSVSGLAALAIGVFFTGPIWAFVLVALIWGFTVVADSAQFSAAVSELADQSLVGSALAFQMGIGFAITLLTVWLIPQIAEITGTWRWSFAVLAIGPALGVVAMLQLRKHPEATRMAQGRR
ncbi:nitrate/nitrite transporter NarK [Rhodovulum imhoffii]|uniref:Nitrate/nitrite transporter NarK n=1 Tax=Rhodovulum imhoffii TaxID=365340 RepID=A0A2T5BNQ8_9RHOB|nr:MFS transporter [Rhodovulum imhoffii]MBK5933622.1 MFS transporter [Rhodovulum imhoffii]PTN00622.1 nitrate/nitrite transporter NarK [Rhodovulum imhoffii]